MHASYTSHGNFHSSGCRPLLDVLLLRRRRRLTAS